MPYPADVKERALNLRKKGYSIKEIASLLHIARSTSSLWTANISLNKKAQKRLQRRRILGQYNAIKTHRSKSEAAKKVYLEKAVGILSKIKFNQEVYKLLCSLLLWAEGEKWTSSYVSFINSDPITISLFLKLLRLSFLIQEDKLRALVHIHEYHDNHKLKIFWSQITKIPLLQFNKSYLKPHTQKRIRENYKGTIRIRYYDSKIALELHSLYNTFAGSLRV